MRAFNYFTLITLAALSVACNEKISPKLLDANQSTTVPPVIEPEVYNFKVKNTSPESKKFHLHKSGADNFENPCEIRTTEKFTTAHYTNPMRKPEFDITCIFEAEELSLNLDGFSFQFEASPNTCEYVGYSPFSFYNFQPGDSSASYTQVICESGVNNARIAGDPNLPIDGMENEVRCNRLILDDPEIPSTLSVSREMPDDEMRLCRYDHTQNVSFPGPNCDVGEISITDIIYSEIPATDTEPARLDVQVRKPRTVKCSGNVTACISGPIKDEPESTSLSRVMTVEETKKNESYVSTRDYPRAPYDAGNYYYANFRRNLASPHIDFGVQPTDYDTSDSGFMNYINSFMSQRTYFPLLLENYSAGKTYGAVANLTSTDNHVMAGALHVQKSKSLAGESFMGLTDPTTDKSYRTSPYYTFYCLDGAREVKARIKMVVRDWDRFFSNDKTHFSLISDIYNLGHARIDNPWGIEFPGDLDPINGLNDIDDWDDIIPMTRSPGVIDIGATIWEPNRGFHNPRNFPRFKDEQ